MGADDCQRAIEAEVADIVRNGRDITFADDFLASIPFLVEAWVTLPAGMPPLIRCVPPSIQNDGVIVWVDLAGNLCASLRCRL